jgi:hypothetical protein
MARIEIKTKIDITNSNVRHPDLGSEKELNQFRNYTTFMQVLGLRSVFDVVQEPTLDKDQWTMIINTDRDDVFLDGKDPVGLLKLDLDKVPIITGLNETAQIKNNLIRTLGKELNTFVSILR